MDRYTFYLLEFLEDIHPASKTNMNDLVWMFLPFTQHQKVYPYGRTICFFFPIV